MLLTKKAMLKVVGFLLDYGNCVAHIFIEEEREFYNLEQLWADAPSEEICGEQK